MNIIEFVQKLWKVKMDLRVLQIEDTTRGPADTFLIQLPTRTNLFDTVDEIIADFNNTDMADTWLSSDVTTILKQKGFQVLEVDCFMQGVGI